MRRMGGWLAAKSSPSTASKSMTALDEHAALQDAMGAAVLIINDEMEQAEIELSKGTSPFHKLGRATAVFLRAALGFEKEVIEQASSRIAEAEESAWEFQRRAIRDHATSHQSKIYPMGAEYALCHAEAQLMSAVVAVLNESLTESLRGFYKLRKAFTTLNEIHEAEKAWLRKNGLDQGNSQQSSAAASITTVSNEAASTDQSAISLNDSGMLTPDSSDDELEFEDALDKPAEEAPTKYNGHLEMPDLKNLSLNDTSSKPSGPSPISTIPTGVDADSGGPAAQADREIDFRTLTDDPIDLFIHSGVGLCFGLLQLLLSMIPPAFGKILSIFSFRGDREAGLRLLWSSTKFKHNVNGAMAGLITLGFHNGAIAFCDILSKDALPEARLRKLLTEMRELYPKSKLWLLEECRMLSRDKRLEDSVKKMSEGPESSLKQIEALALFEKSLSLLYLHRYEECAESFIKCVGLNNWSHAMYYYIAGACYVELYRMWNEKDPEKAAVYAKKAEKYLKEVPSHTGKKRLMARQLPFDVFVGRKITKWEARSKSRDCSFVNAVGVSPVVEMTYFWSGFTRMRPDQLVESMERLAWCEEQAQWQNEPSDEKTILSFLRGVCQRFLGEYKLAEATLQEGVLSHELSQLKACEHPDTWTLPVAHYELAVLHWNVAGGEDGDRDQVQKCNEELYKVEHWEAYELDARIGLKIRTARETLKKAGIPAS